jgi:hypothetical protein
MVHACMLVVHGVSVERARLAKGRTGVLFTEVRF